MAFLVQEHYDTDYYEPQVERYVRRTRFTRVRLENVFGLLGGVDGKDVLDLGCGMGTFTIETALRGGRAVGIDPAPASLRTANDLAERLGADGARFVAGDAGNLPIPDESVDAVICADLTEHLDDATLVAMLGEIARVLRPGGTLALYTPSPTHLFERLKAQDWLIKQDPSHIGLRSMADLVQSVRQAGLEVERAYFRPTHLPVYSTIEAVLAPLPVLGGLFRRRVCIAGRKPVSTGKSNRE